MPGSPPPATERGLVSWARRVSYGAVRRRGELEERRGREQEERVLRERSCSWYYFDAGRRFHLEADLPAPDGARVAAAVEELASRVPVMPGEEHPRYAGARRADALVALCTHGAAEADAERGIPDPGALARVRATVVLHARVGAPERGAALEGGGVADPGAVQRLSCTGLIEHLHGSRTGRLLSRISERRTPPAWMARQVRYRDGGCTFPGCGTLAFTEAHHIVFHRFGGATTLENLTLLCSFHHRLVHEGGWSLRRTPEGELAWRRPDGRPHTPGPVLRGSDLDPVAEPVVFGPFGEAGDGGPLGPLGTAPARDGPSP
ncbi:MAG: hypothetical protein KatS3mg014_2706 [Actinomycetota bacterium]|nr:MAG: hypothetical protein KatS3mg014_2706 [Actinomycetota bacterium]